jgi:hypothetical protein
LKAEDQPVRAFRDLAGRFTARTPILKNIPSRRLFVKIDGAASFVIAIIPLSEVRFDHGLRLKSSQGTGSPCALPRTAKDAGKFDSAQAWCKLPGFVFAMRRQRNISCAGMLARERPFGFAMPDEIKLQRSVLGAAQLLALLVPWLIDVMLKSAALTMRRLALL